MMKKLLVTFFFIASAPFLACHAASIDSPEGRLSQQAPVELDQLLTPDIGGIKQFVQIKTDDASKPVLLFLSGGPGSSMMNNGASFTSILKTRFTIVQWDQRDAGKTLRLNASPTQPTVAQMEKDTYEVIQLLRRELKQNKIYLLGSSWGNVLGFSIVRNHPELLHAYFASNPVVSQFASEKELLVALKMHFKDDAVASEELGRVSNSLSKAEDMFFLRKWLFFKEGKQFALSEDFKNGSTQWAKTWLPVWNEVMAIDLPRTLKKVECPIYFLVGKNDLQASAKIAQAYFEQVKAPKKGLYLFENSGHQIHQEEPEKFQHRIIEALDTLRPSQN